MPYDIHGGMSYFYGMAAADFNKDGQQEVAYADSFAASRDMRRDRDALIYLNSNEGGSELIYREDFSFHPNPNPNPHMLIERMIPFDVDGDDWLDIVAVANSHDAVVAYMNPGARRLGRWRREVLTIETPGAVNLVTGDFDGNGAEDIAVSMRSQSTVWPEAKPGIGWLRRAVNGEWIYQDIVVNDARLTEPRTLQIANIPGRSAAVIVTADLLSGAAYTIGRHDNVWSMQQIEGVNTQGSAYNLVHDLSGDGLDDFVFGRGDGIYYADLSGDLGAPAVFKATGFHSVTDAFVSEIVAADVHGDGATGVAYALRHAGIFYSRKSPRGGWESHWITSTPDNYLGIAVTDYDDDGRQDVLVNIEYDRNTLQVWQNKGPPQ